ncbi:hypothetical protein Rhopal_002555-T1 [Rhodotorula paludigena]|uniref:Uncharacterized protein n=1 Tax=Rhodotorula paludigena TaxID=86838 RepID=A0AAV5GH59_9BASI|nr:hypothetical protein Rhopal_002555-T1 [Rhodotorula paludigena]
MTPDNLPSLRAVRFVGNTLDLSDLPPLLAQLDHAQVNETVFTDLMNGRHTALQFMYAAFAAYLEAPEFPIALNNPLPILTMLSLERAMGASQHASRHLGIYNDGHYSLVHELFKLCPGTVRQDRDRYTIPIVFCRLEELLKASRSLLSLVIPHSLRTFAPNDAAAVAAIERFEARCRDEGVELIWSTGQREDEIVCRDFQPYARRLREEREARALGAGGPARGREV